MSKRSTPRYRGVLHDIDGLMVRGWVVDLDDPHESVVVELIADGEPIALAVASGCDEVMPEMAQGHVFRKMLPESVLQYTHKLTARVANSEIFLECVLHPSRMFDDAGSRSIASIWSDGGLRVRGVVRKFSSGRAPPRLRLRVDADWLEWVVADKREAELVAEGIEEHWTLDYTLPIRYADGRPHVLRAYSDEGIELQGSPLTVLQFEGSARAWLQSLEIPQEYLLALDGFLALQEKFVPLSLGWREYSGWKRSFASSAAPSSSRSVLVVVGAPSSNDQANSEATVRSIMQQTHACWRALIWTQSDAEVIGDADERIEFVTAEIWAERLRNVLTKVDAVASMECGDTWHPDLLRHALCRIDSGAHLTYCDVDDVSGGPPWFKPDWCPDTFLQLPLLDHGFVFDVGALGDQISVLSACPLDWPWQVVSMLGDGVRVAHIPHPLHTRGDGMPCASPRIAGALLGRPDLTDLIRKAFAVEWVQSADGGPHQVRWPCPDDWPSTCLIVPTRNAASMLRTCVESLQSTDYPKLRICVVDNQSSDEDALDYLASLDAKGIQVLRWPYPFNFASLNNFAVRSVEAEVVGFINNDVRALDDSWLKTMVRHLVRPKVSAVGAKLLWRNSMVQHVGVTLGLHGIAGHAGNQWKDNDAGYHYLNRVIRTVSAVTAACLLVRRADYLSVDGMDECAFPVNFNDVDLCLRLGQKVGRIVVTPEAVLEHAESATRGRDESPCQIARLHRESANLLQRWSGLIAADPYYNPNLNLDRYSYDGLAFPPRASSTCAHTSDAVVPT